MAACDRQDLVLDPFCGTGTTALVCAQAGIACDTVDINPFLIWLTKAKCAQYSPPAIQAAQVTLADALATMCDAPLPLWSPPIKDIDKWWPPASLRLLSYLHAQFNQPTLPAAARDLLNVMFCRAAIELASVSFGHQSMSFRQQSSGPTPPILIEQTIRSTFDRIAAEIFASAVQALPATSIAALCGDARQLDTMLPLRRYTQVITSPPYPNRMSYIRELRPYMYWLGYLRDGRQAGELDWQAIGGTWGCATSNLTRWQHDESYPVPYPGFHALVEEVSQRSSLLGRYIDKYFHDIAQHIASLRQVLAPAARVSYVVGNSKFYDVVLPTQEIYAAIFAAQGFTEVCVTPIRKRTSKKELFEYIVSARLA